MHHVRLHRARTDESDLHSQIVEVARLEARDKYCLRSRLDLEYAHRLATADHLTRIGNR